MRAITSSHRADTDGLNEYAAEGKNLAFIGPRLIQVNNILRIPSLVKGLQAYHEKFLCMGPDLNDKQFNNPITLKCLKQQRIYTWDVYFVISFTIARRGMR